MDYEINYNTQFIVPIEDNTSKVVEQDDEYIINNSTLNIMEHSCEYFGSSYEGRKEGTRKLLGITHKPPIIIEESNKIIFFPTNSPENSSCCWINLESIERYYRINSTKSAILFKNGDVVEFNVSYGSLTNQILRATRLKYILQERTEKKSIF